MNDIFTETCDKYGYVFKHNILAFQKGPLSNWFGGSSGQSGGFKRSGIYYNCGEQYIMAEKARLFNDDVSLAEILATTSPKKQKELGRKVQNFNAEVWDYEKKFIASSCCQYKTIHNPHIMKFIESIPPFCIIVEAGPLG